jgi:hypothetical protein
MNSIPTAESVNALMLVSGAEAATTSTLQQIVESEVLPPEAVQVLEDKLAWTKLEPLLAKVYQEVFTQDEVDGLTAFYRSSTGAAFINKTPLLMQKSLELMQSLLRPA